MQFVNDRLKSKYGFSVKVAVTAVGRIIWEMIRSNDIRNDNVAIMLTINRSSRFALRTVEESIIKS